MHRKYYELKFKLVSTNYIQSMVRYIISGNGPTLYPVMIPLGTGGALHCTVIVPLDGLVVRRSTGGPDAEIDNILGRHGSASLCRDDQKAKWRLQCKY